MKNDKNNIDFIKINENIQDIKFPIVFICKLISYKDLLDDYTTSIILRIFFKYHFTTVLETNLLLLFMNEYNNYEITTQTIIKLYSLIKQKKQTINTLEKWYNEYNNPEFWVLDINNQIEYLINKRTYFKAIFECSNGGFPFYLKLLPILENELYKEEIMVEIIKRLLLVVNIFNEKILTTVNIPLIKVSEFYEMPNIEIVNYLALVFNILSIVLNGTVELFMKFKIISEQLNELLNPFLYNIEEKEIQSDTDLDDLELFC
jgi:hypothetical protein